MKKSNLKRLLVILLALMPMAFAAACSQPNNSTAGGDPSDIVDVPSEDNPSEDNPSEDNPSEDNPSEDNPSEETPEEKPTKPSLPGGLVDGGNYEF